MKLWSRGLGKTELKMDCRYYTVKSDPGGDNVYIVGKITDPVNWEFRVTLEPEDIPGFIKMFMNYCIIKLTLKNMYKYIIYLFNKRKYAEAAGYDIEEKVDEAYMQMMNGRQRPSHLSRA
ncbi:MAG: hypothetical protein JRF40_08255 [Deltaproteobacteria bacterium]|nr:hypothetical protein [Deltaproteobacteria bacterium]MBW2219465.1 hypothetical protein [Deltaproteobacteria bacterium]